MTSYETIYNRFARKITDYDIVELSDIDLEEMLLDYLHSAMAKFRKISTDLSKRDDTMRVFTDDLLDVEIEILACLMVVEWITPQLNSTQYTKQFFGGKDEKFFSQKNQIDGLRDMKKDMQLEAKKLRRDYIANNNSYLKREE